MARADGARGGGAVQLEPGLAGLVGVPGEPAHPEDITAFIVDADGVEVAIPLSREERTALAEDLMTGAHDAD